MLYAAELVSRSRSVYSVLVLLLYVLTRRRLPNLALALALAQALALALALAQALAQALTLSSGDQAPRLMRPLRRLLRDGRTQGHK